MTAPERIWIDAWGGNWSPQAGGTQGIEYIRADIAAVQPAQVRVKPLDIAYVQRHAFLSGVVAARNVPSHEPINGPALWLDYDPGDNPALSRILAALEPQPDSRDELIAEAVDAALKQAAFWVEQAMVLVAPEGYPQRAALDSYRKQFSTLVLASNKGMV